MSLPGWNLSAHMEPEAKAFGERHELEPEICAHLSIAISLKRIADALGHMTTEPCNNYGETFVPAIARAISDGMARRV